MKPPKSILDPTFRYVSAAKSDIRETFKRIRREQVKAAALPPVELPGKRVVVSLLPKEKRKA